MGVNETATVCNISILFVIEHHLPRVHNSYYVRSKSILRTYVCNVDECLTWAAFLHALGYLHT